MTDIQYIQGPAGPAGSDGVVDYTVVNTMVNNILSTNPNLKGEKGDTGATPTESQIAAAAAAYIQANENEFKPVLDYSQIISSIETWMQTDAIKPIFTGDAANVDNTALQNNVVNAVLAYIQANPNQFKGNDAVLNYSTIIEGIKSWMTSTPEIISIFKGNTGNTGLPGTTPSLDYNIIKNDVNNYLSANLSTLVSPSVIQSAFVDSSGNLISSLSTAISSATSAYLVANPIQGADQNTVNGYISSYLQSNPQGVSSNDVNSLIASYLQAHPINSLTIEALTPLLTELNVSYSLNYNKPHYDFSRANNSFMYTLVPSGSYNASNKWKVEAWVYYIGGTPDFNSGYATIMDNRAKENWDNTNFFVINIWKDKPAVVSPAGTSLTQFGLDGTLTVPKNQWSHICWQYSQDGFNTFVNGVLGASTDLSADWNNTSGMLCFGATVDFQQGDFYHLEGSIAQLLFRAGSTVDLYPTSGFTPPANLTAVASGKTDVVYLMKHGFQDLLKPDGCIVLETST